MSKGKRTRKKKKKEELAGISLAFSSGVLILEISRSFYVTDEHGTESNICLSVGLTPAPISLILFFFFLPPGQTAFIFFFLLSFYVIGYSLFLKIENWKHYNKIIFKYVNSTVESIFKDFFVEKSICGFCKQCTRPTIFQPNARMHRKRAFQMHTMSYFETLSLDSKFSIHSSLFQKNIFSYLYKKALAK